tara:strand:- start:224 stop:811 length:588 start_codon:yes stop_codon:yes gene_type:complete
MAISGTRLGELLLEEDVLTKRQLQKALAMQQAGDDRKVGEILIELKYITIDDLTDIMLNHPPQTRWKETEKEVVKESVMGNEPRELSEDTKFSLDIKTMISAAVGIATLVGFYYMMMGEIQEAKELPSLETLYSEEYPSRPEGYNWPRSYEQYKDNVEGLQDEMDAAYGMIEELEEVIKELQQDIKSLERRKRDK